MTKLIVAFRNLGTRLKRESISRSFILQNENPARFANGRSNSVPDVVKHPG
jgi:hypothetical protein